MRRVLLALFCSALVPAAATADQKRETRTSMANPAATFCIENGGTYEIRTRSDGSKAGTCILPDGEEIDAWDYLRSHFED